MIASVFRQIKVGKWSENFTLEFIQTYEEVTAPLAEAPCAVPPGYDVGGQSVRGDGRKHGVG